MLRTAIIFFALFPATAFAQLDFGVKGGLNIADVVMTNFVNPDVEADLGLKLGAHGGVFVNGVVDDRIRAAAELLYSNKGVKGITSIHLHYIAVPLLAQYRLTKRLFAELGPEPAYLLAARSAHGDESGTYNSRFDLSLDGGFCFDTPRLIFGIRYCVGLFSVREPFEIQGPSGPETVKYQNRVVQITLGIRLSGLQDRD